jgi:phosphatidylethanolamine-binding protein (PEBP) family uncharacterized protein
MIGPAKAARTGSLVLSVLALAAVLALSGCGGGEEDSSTATTGTSSETAEATRNSTEQVQDQKDQEANGNSAQDKQGSGDAPQTEGEREPGITPQQRQETTVASMTLESPSFQSGATLKAKYTCDGGDTSPALRWKGTPSEAEEQVLLVLSVRNGKLTFNWAVAGLDPGLSEIEEGRLPAGAVVGENSFGKDGYSLCPEPGSSETYIFMLFAIPKALDPEPGFEARPLREEVLAEHGNVGLLNAAYVRK